MSEPTTPGPLHPFEAILRQCAAADPKPWHPLAPAPGPARQDLDEDLEDLALDGLVRIADGVTLTPAGRGVLEDPAALGGWSKGGPCSRPCAAASSAKRSGGRGGRSSPGCSSA